jgi:hypothetical protein
VHRKKTALRGLQTRPDLLRKRQISRLIDQSCQRTEEPKN